MGFENSNSGIYLHVDFPDAQEIRFNKARVRRAFVDVGRTLLRDNRRAVARRAISSAGQAPGYQSGDLAKSIGYFVPRATANRPGFMVKLSHNKGEGASKDIPSDGFYPAYLFYGVRRGAQRAKSHRKGASGGSSWRITPRQNYFAKTLKNRSYEIQRTLFTALRASVRPEKTT